MCLIVIAWQQHSEYPLIVAANRDEYYDRPTELAHVWQQPPGLLTTKILAGKDLSAGGTWLGINDKGKFAAVTNYREGIPETQPHSRGELTTDYLNSSMPPEQYAQKCLNSGNQYNGYNLILNEGDRLFYCSNRYPDIKELPPGIYTLSNHLLNSPWPKSIHVKDELIALLSSGSVSPSIPTNPQPINIDDIISCLHRREPFADEYLPDTGVGLEIERMLSPPFILSPDYGTRSTTVVLRDNRGKTVFVEQSYESGGLTGERKVFDF